MSGTTQALPSRLALFADRRVLLLWAAMLVSASIFRISPFSARYRAARDIPSFSASVSGDRPLPRR